MSLLKYQKKVFAIARWHENIVYTQYPTIHSTKLVMPFKGDLRGFRLRKCAFIRIMSLYHEKTYYY